MTNIKKDTQRKTDTKANAFSQFNLSQEIIDNLNVLQYKQDTQK